MSDTPADIMKAAYEAMRRGDERGALGVISKAITSERNRCLTIIQSIETRNAAEAHMLETIVRKVRGDE